MNNTNSTQVKYRKGDANERKTLESLGFAYNSETTEWSNNEVTVALTKGKTCQLSDGSKTFNKVSEFVEYYKSNDNAQQELDLVIEEVTNEVADDSVLEEVNEEIVYESEEEIEKPVVVFVADYEVECQVKTVGNRKLDVFNSLVWISNQSEIIEDDKEFLEGFVIAIEDAANDLIAIGEDKAEISIKKSKAIKDAKSTYDKYISDQENELEERKKNKADGSHLILHINGYEIECEVDKERDFKTKLAMAYRHMCSSVDVIEDDVELMVTIKKNLESLSREFNFAKLEVPKDVFTDCDTWEDWKNLMLATMKATNVAYLESIKKEA